MDPADFINWCKKQKTWRMRLRWTCTTLSCPLLSWTWEQRKADFYVVNIEIRPEITASVSSSNKTPDIRLPCIPHHEKGRMRWKGRVRAESRGLVEDKAEGGSLAKSQKSKTNQSATSELYWWGGELRTPLLYVPLCQQESGRIAQHPANMLLTPESGFVLANLLNSHNRGSPRPNP